MERWAANALCIVGIILTLTLVVCGCLYFVFLSQWNAHGGFSGNRDTTAATNYMFGAVVLGFLGICFIAWLARGIYVRQPVPLASTEADSSARTSFRHLPPAGQHALVRLAWCLGIRLAVSALDWVYTVLQFEQLSNELPRRYHSLVPFTVVASILYAAPYAVLIYLVRQHPSRTVLAFALALPAVSILQALLAIVPVMSGYTRNPVQLATLVIPPVINLVIILLGYQAAQRARLRASASSVFTAAVVSLVYFCSLYLIVPTLRRMAMS